MQEEQSAFATLYENLLSASVITTRRECLAAVRMVLY